MVIGIVFAGILAGLLASLGTLTAGMSIWVALLLYPFAGTLGALAMIAWLSNRHVVSNPHDLADLGQSAN